MGDCLLNVFYNEFNVNMSLLLTDCSEEDVVSGACALLVSVSTYFLLIEQHTHSSHQQCCCYGEQIRAYTNFILGVLHDERFRGIIDIMNGAARSLACILTNLLHSNSHRHLCDDDYFVILCKSLIDRELCGLEELLFSLEHGKEESREGAGCTYSVQPFLIFFKELPLALYTDRDSFLLTTRITKYILRIISIQYDCHRSSGTKATTGLDWQGCMERLFESASLTLEDGDRLRQLLDMIMQSSIFSDSNKEEYSSPHAITIIEMILRYSGGGENARLLLTVDKLAVIAKALLKHLASKQQALSNDAESNLCCRYYAKIRAISLLCNVCTIEPSVLLEGGGLDALVGGEGGIVSLEDSYTTHCHSHNNNLCSDAFDDARGDEGAPCSQCTLELLNSIRSLTYSLDSESVFKQAILFVSLLCTLTQQSSAHEQITSEITHQAIKLMSRVAIVCKGLVKPTLCICISGVLGWDLLAGDWGFMKTLSTLHAEFAGGCEEGEIGVTVIVETKALVFCMATILKQSIAPSKDQEELLFALSTLRSIHFTRPILASILPNGEDSHQTLSSALQSLIILGDEDGWMMRMEAIKTALSIISNGCEEEASVMEIVGLILRAASLCVDCGDCGEDGNYLYFDDDDDHFLLKTDDSPSCPPFTILSALLSTATFSKTITRALYTTTHFSAIISLILSAPCHPTTKAATTLLQTLYAHDPSLTQSLLFVGGCWRGMLGEVISDCTSIAGGKSARSASWVLSKLCVVGEGVLIRPWIGHIAHMIEPLLVYSDASSLTTAPTIPYSLTITTNLLSTLRTLLKMAPEPFQHKDYKASEDGGGSTLARKLLQRLYTLLQQEQEQQHPLPSDKQMSTLKAHTKLITKALGLQADLLQRVRDSVGFGELVDILMATVKFLSIPHSNNNNNNSNVDDTDFADDFDAANICNSRFDGGGGVRREAIRLLGVVGALDPYTLQHRRQQQPPPHPPHRRVTDTTPLPNYKYTHPNYHAAITIKLILELLQANMSPDRQKRREWRRRQGGGYKAIMQACVRIAASLEEDQSAFVDFIVPKLFDFLNSVEEMVEEDGLDSAYTISALAMLAQMSGLHWRPHTQKCIHFLQRQLNRNDLSDKDAKITMVALMELVCALVNAVGREDVSGELRALVPSILAHLQCVNAIVIDGGGLELELLRALCALVPHAHGHSRAILNTLLTLTRNYFSCDTNDYASNPRVITCILWIVDRMLCVLDVSLEMPLIIAIVQRGICKGFDDVYDVLAERLHNHSHSHNPFNQQQNIIATTNGNTNNINDEHAEINIQEITETFQRFSESADEDDWWGEWRTLELVLLKCSGSAALIACYDLVHDDGSAAFNHNPTAANSTQQTSNSLAKTLFKYAFMHTLLRCPSTHQQILKATIETSLCSPNIPRPLLLSLLDSIEWVEKIDGGRVGAVFVDRAGLADLSGRCHAYARSLYYEEGEWRALLAEYKLETSLGRGDSANNNTDNNILALAASTEAIISINSKLQLQDSAFGIWKVANERVPECTQRIGDEWLEKLGMWDDAMGAHERAWNASLSPRQSFHDQDHAYRPFYHLPNWSALLGMFRCMHAQANYKTFLTLTNTHWDKLPNTIKAAVAPMAASAAWSTANWSQMKTFLTTSPKAVAAASTKTPNTCIMQSVVACKMRARGDSWQRVAREWIGKGRDLLDIQLANYSIKDAYMASYEGLVAAQMLSELEQAIQCMEESEWIVSKGGGEFKVRPSVLKEWEARINDCQPCVSVWQSLLKIRSLIINDKNSNSDADEKYKNTNRILTTQSLKFASMCRQEGRYALATKTLLSLFPTNHDNNVNSESQLSLDNWQHVQFLWDRVEPGIVYAWLSHVWQHYCGDLSVCEEIAACMAVYCEYLSKQHADNHHENSVNTTNELLSACYLKQAQWQKHCTQEAEVSTLLASQKKSMHTPTKSCMDAFMAATEYATESNEAWRAWALVNFEIAGKQVAYSRVFNAHVIPAIQGLFKSITLPSAATTNNTVLQDTLRLLTIWFRWGGSSADVCAAIGDGLPSVPIHSWLPVIPQLIARIHIPSPSSRRLLHSLLCEIGRLYPQALIYPLTVASRSQSVGRRSAALALLERMQAHSWRLVEQARLFSREMIGMAVFWEECWLEGLEEASRLYFGGDVDIDGMFAILDPLHEMINEFSGDESSKSKKDGDGSSNFRKGNNTPTPIQSQFLQEHHKDLQAAKSLTIQYKRTGNQETLSDAWDIYYRVFRRLGRRVSDRRLFSVADCSRCFGSGERLFDELAIPGTYQGGNRFNNDTSPTNVVILTALQPTIEIINSKQRPRKLSFVGSDGHIYPFLLKGHEDMRQDERVMQLFALINCLLASPSHPQTRKRHLAIKRYAVIPLSHQTGLVGWVDGCDTIHALVREHRENSDTLLSLEHRMLLQCAPDYDRLPLLGKVQVFEQVMCGSGGPVDSRDIAIMMWKDSPTPEIWLDRRQTYTRSLAVMSMTGYILGLGDRHPSNLMIDRHNGHIVHIDFGDCFEVARERERWPERTPFRLTFMMVQAMEVAGVEGTFRRCCEEVMRVLRIEEESLMAVLEAFIHDPLINWRLMSTENTNGIKNKKKTTIPKAKLAMFPSSQRPPPPPPLEISRLQEESIQRPDKLPRGALNALQRVAAKLNGRDFISPNPPPTVEIDAPCGQGRLSVEEQVERLIGEAVAVENLCRAYVGWCPFW